MVLLNEHMTLLMLFDGKTYTFPPFALLRIMASVTRTSQCVNQALLGESLTPCVLIFLSHFTQPIPYDISTPEF
jgi:hypothetical protein